MRFLFVALALAIFSTPAAAQTNTKWQLTIYGLTCNITLVKQGDPAASRGPIRVKQCAQEMSDLRGWRYGDSADQIVLRAGGQDVAHVNWRSNDFWEGWLIVGGDAPVTMRRIQAQAQKPRATTPGAVGQCKVYYNTRRCADARDLGEIRSGALETLANMNVRFLSSVTSSLLGQVPRGSCLSVSRCTSSILNEETWCEVKYDGTRSGWILKEDKSSVYSRDGCG
ncbi:MAG: hypothetical protein RIG84_13645 [Roseovarius sp.]